MGANREYKNSVFTTLFDDADKLLELYSALSGCNYGEGTAIEINTLDDVLFMNLMNDISFTVDGKLVVLIEHQSSISENIPLRLLLYIARVYEKIIDKKTVYQQKLMKIPMPEFVVLYNGKSEFPSEKELRLSDAFMSAPGRHEKYGNLDLTVRILNINLGHNEGIVNRSATLCGYVTFIGRVREGVEKGLDLDHAITEALKYCEEHDILQPFLTSHASEVINMLTTEFNMEDAIAVWKEEGREEGRVEGIIVGETRGEARGEARGETHVLSLLEAGHSVEEIKKILNREREKGANYGREPRI
jgi:hypothetical protein